MNRISARMLFGVVLGIGCGVGSAADRTAALESADVTRAFVVPERDLLPENVAYDPIERAFFLGSTRKGKIVRIGADGRVTDFVPARRDGLWQVIGMKIDVERSVLWVASSMGENLEGAAANPGPGSAGVFQFDLATSRLLRRTILRGGPAAHFFNDLVLTPSGDAYVTHMFDEPAVYRIRVGSDQLELVARLPAESYPNGIALGNAGRLFIATSSGLATVDTSTGQFQMLGALEGVSTRGIDGLYVRGDQLFAVRPDVNEVRRYQLDAGQGRVVASDVLLANHADFSIPTTGVLVGDSLFVVANSNFQFVREDGSLPELATLSPPVVLRIRLP